MSSIRLFTRLPHLHRLRSRTLVVALLTCACALALLHPAAAAPGHDLTPTSGGGLPFYIQVSTAANTYASWTDLDSQITNNNPNALVFVTPNWSPNGVQAAAFDTHPLGVWYDFVTHKWAIFNEDEAPMPLGAAFNVDAESEPGDRLFVATATPATISGSYASISNPYTDGQPNNTLIVTPNWSAGGTYDPHPLGVFYQQGTGLSSTKMVPPWSLGLPTMSIPSYLRMFGRWSISIRLPPPIVRAVPRNSTTGI